MNLSLSVLILAMIYVYCIRAIVTLSILVHNNIICIAYILVFKKKTFCLTSLLNAECAV